MKKSTTAIIIVSAVAFFLIAGAVLTGLAGKAILDRKEKSDTPSTKYETVTAENDFTVDTHSIRPAGDSTRYSEPAKENVEKDYLSTLSDNDIKMLNIFLSNFSEAFIENIDTSDMAEMIDFACTNTDINYSEKITYDGVTVTNPENGWTYSGWVTEDYVAERVDRFFDVEIEHMSTESNYHTDGKYYFDMADGEQYRYFTKVTSATENSDGTVTVEYDVYWWSDEYTGSHQKLYEGIGSENLSGCEYGYSGTAVVKPVYLGGEGYSNYKLVSLNRD